ncbi:MAG: hypothetical protein RBR28_02270 [Lentimicrobium sp.]|jgi:uncharacterized protein YjbI with pentapeptide repeats|nr:hypothetical protein [Lentimicrobium sp.]
MKPSFIAILLALVFATGCHANNDSAINNGLNSQQIIKLIDKGKHVSISGKIITDDLDFTAVKGISPFSSSQSTIYVDVPVTFINCIFMGKVMANRQQDKVRINTHFTKSLTFEACDFRADADFEGITVDGPVNFTGAIFREKALFNNVVFNGQHIFFTAFSCEKLFSMQESRILGTIDFFKAVTKGKFSFQSTVFNGNARFSDMECGGKCDFSLADFRSDALFTYTNFGSNFEMANARVWGKLDLISVLFTQDVILTNAFFYNTVNFTKSEAKGEVDLSGSYFLTGPPVFEDFVVQSANLKTNGTKIMVLKEFKP